MPVKNSLDVGVSGPGIEIPSHHVQVVEMTRAELKDREAVIERGKQTFVEVGTALMEIRDGRGYRFEYRTFEEYCQKRWDFTPQHAGRLMRATEVIQRIEPIGSILPQTESQVRPITSLPPEKQPEAWKEAVESAPEGKVTAAHVENVVKKYKPAPRREPIREETTEAPDPFPEEHETEIPDPPARPDTVIHAVSAHSDETELLKWIIGLFNGGCAFDLDPTYSMGRIWTGLPEPIRKSDLHPQVSDCAKADVCNLPYPAESLDSIFCDLPFVLKNGDRTDGHWGIIEARFGSFKNWKELCETYRGALAEFYRILRKDGLVCLKCQDQISGSKFYSSMVMSINAACDLGFTVEQIFVYYNLRAMPNPNQGEPQHARNIHCYFVVFRK